MRTALGALLLPAALLLPGSARALEPTTVRVEGSVALVEGLRGSPRDLAFQDAMEKAVFEVARLYIPPKSLQLEEERLREALAVRAQAFVLTYRVHGAPTRRASREEPGVQELVLDLTATVDAAQVRGALETLGVLNIEGDRPSVAIRVRPATRGSWMKPALFNEFEREVMRALEGRGYVIVDPALHPGGGSYGGALELARGLGADVAIELVVRWRQRQQTNRMVGGVAEVRVQALRARDGSELASARFDAPAYHQQREEALLRGLEALQGQVADNLVLQLERNWSALSREDGPLLLRLSNVSSSVQVDVVQRTLRDTLGAQRADLVELGPGSAELRVRAPLSPGALQERLSGVRYDGFSLEPVSVAKGEVNMRVLTPIAAPGSAGRR